MTNHQSADNQHELEQEIQPEDVVDELKEQGVLLEDTKTGVRWTKRG